MSPPTDNPVNPGESSARPRPPLEFLATPDDAVIEHRSIRARRGRGRARITVNLTAMIDVTFLLLVYFMVATEFKVGEEVYRLDLPQRLQSTAERDPFELDRPPLRIEIATTGPAGTDYRLQLAGPYPQPESFDDLTAYLAAEQITEENLSGRFDIDYPLIIQPMRSTSWEHTIDAFNAAARARYTNIQFAKPQ